MTLPVIEQVKEEAKRRWDNPFIGSVVIAFIIWNWKAILLFIYPMADSFYARLHYASTMLYPDWGCVVLFIYVGPILTGTAFVTLLPMLSNYINSVYHEHEVKLKNKRGEIDERLTENQLEIVRLKVELERSDKENDKLIKKIDEINQHEQKAIFDKEKQYEAHVINMAELIDQSSSMKTMLNQITNGGQVDMNPSLADVLFRAGLITKGSMGTYRATPLGQAVNGRLNETPF